MCGRYALYGPHSRYRDHFDTANDLLFSASFNIAPSQTLPVVGTDESGRRLFVMARWGLIPSWVKDPEALHPINAKAETAAIKPMFRRAFRSSRVLVPAAAYYEWKAGNGKQPYLIRLRDGEPMGMGGLLEHWHGPDGEIVSFAILTTAANPLMADIHERMPVIIRPEDYAIWLDPQSTDVTQLQSLARPYPERLMEAYPVSRKVNSPRNDSPDLVEEVSG